MAIGGMSLLEMRILQLRHRLQKVAELSRQRRTAARAMSPEAIAAAVGRTARQVMSVKESEWQRFLSGELRVPPGHLHDFFDELDARHGLWIPEEERRGLNSVADVIEFLTRPETGPAA